MRLRARLAPSILACVFAFIFEILTRLPHGVPGALLLVGLLLFLACGVVFVSWGLSCAFDAWLVHVFSACAFALGSIAMACCHSSAFVLDPVFVRSYGFGLARFNIFRFFGF